jgi:hypothetical protein
MQAVLDEICARAAEHDPEAESPEDWLFGRVRVLAARQGLAGAAPVRSLAPLRQPLGPETVHGEADPVSAETPVPEQPRRRRLLAVVLGALLLALAGAVAAGLWSERRPGPGPTAGQQGTVMPFPEPEPALPPAAPEQVVPALPPLETVPPPAASSTEPTWWDLPTTDPVVPEPPVAAAPPEEARPPDPAGEQDVAAPAPPLGQRRVFIHYTAGSAEGRASARLLEERLPRERFAVAGLRPVTFRIGSGGVRYFFLQDRDEARRLLAVSMRALGRGAGPLPRGAGDFTHYAPKPQPGTIEIWLSTR